MKRIINGGQEPQTWAESIQAYERGKTYLPWNPADVPPPTYVKQFDVSRKDREMDPVLMRHRNPDIEAKRKIREEERLRTALNNAKSRQLRVEQNYDIVTHSTFLSGKQASELAPRPSRHPDTRTSYDILNHVPKEKAHSVALIYPDGEGPEVLPQKVVTVEGGKKPHSHLRRDVDVLSNRRVHFPAFLEKHEERMVEEKRFLRETAEEKYRRTHDYNIIAGAFYDQDKERKFVNSRDKLLTMQGRAQQYRLPPSIRYGEGNGYNIINQQPKKTVVDMTSASVQDRGLSKRTRGRETYEDNIRQHERAAAASEQRTLNRPSHMRHVEVLRTGHNVISNRDFAGREGKPPPQPRAKPPMPVWDRLKGKHGIPEAAAFGSRPTAENNDGGQRHGDVTGLGQADSRDAGSSSLCGGQSPASPGGARGNDPPSSRREASPPLRERTGDSGGRIHDHGGGGEKNRGVGGRPSVEAAMPSTKPAVPPLNLSRS
ncbi:unnamed protein product [Ectocarpus fasciculatus]